MWAESHNMVFGYVVSVILLRALCSAATINSVSSL